MQLLGQTEHGGPPAVADRHRRTGEPVYPALEDLGGARFGVRGAFGVDAIWDGRHAWVLEVNPRPPASLELFGPGSFEAHVQGARGLGLPTVPAVDRSRVKVVLYADRDLRAPDPGWWPSGLVRDVPHAGEEIRRGAPVCTLISAEAGVSELVQRGAQLLSALPESIVLHG